jgi:hypothetical protein
MEKTVRSTSLGGLKETDSPESGDSAPSAPQDEGARENGSKSPKALYGALDSAERIFVAHAVLSGDYQQAAKDAAHRNPFELLARKHVQAYLLAVAPKSEHAKALLRPFILEALAHKALRGDAQSARVLLSLPHDAVKKKAEY